MLSERQKVMRHKLYYLRDRWAPANTHLPSVGPGAAVWQLSPKLTLLPLNVRPLSFSISFWLFFLTKMGELSFATRVVVCGGRPLAESTFDEAALKRRRNRKK